MNIKIFAIWNNTSLKLPYGQASSRCSFLAGFNFGAVKVFGFGEDEGFEAELGVRVGHGEGEGVEAWLRQAAEGMVVMLYKDPSHAGLKSGIHQQEVH